MQVNELSLNTNVFSLGALLGSQGENSLIQSINDRCGASSYFGSVLDPFRAGFTNFMNTVVQPIRDVGLKLFSTADKLFNPDQYRAIDSIQELKRGIPPCMHEGIIYYPPMRTFLEEGRIEGFGFDPKSLREDDPYEPVLENGFLEIHSSTLDKDGHITQVFNENTDDPILSFDEVEMLRTTRAYIDKFMEDEATKYFDFTDYPSLHS